MKSTSLTLFTAMIVFATLATPVLLASQDNQNSKHAKFITFDAPGAANGTVANFISPVGAIVGWYSDANNAIHGFVRNPDGVFTTIDVPGACGAYCFGTM